jgi:phosphoserine phosphatase RsbU/P
VPGVTTKSSDNRTLDWCRIIPLLVLRGAKVTKKKTPPRFGRTRDFWERVTGGLRLKQLRTQFISEAKASYGLFSGDVAWEEIGQEPSRIKRSFRSVRGLFLAMLMKLSPARRVLLLLAIAVLILSVSVHRGSLPEFDLSALYGIAILFILLAMELADRATMKRDLEIAREIQQWLVPEYPPKVCGLDIAFATRPQNTVAGDYYDAFLRPTPPAGSGPPPLLIAVADVAGKSVPAALLMATFQASLRALAATPATLEEISSTLDRYCRAHSLGGLRFTTAFLAEVNPLTRQMLYVNAGHNEPILRRSSGEIERLGVGGPPFGLPLFTEQEVSYCLGRIQLQPQDLLFIFTDGTAEAVNAKGEEYGEARLVSCIQNAPLESASETLKDVMADVTAFVGSARQHDDITYLVLRTEAKTAPI